MQHDIYPSSRHRCILTVAIYCVGTVLDSICIHIVVRYMCGHRSRHQMHTRRCWICCRNCPPSVAIVIRNALVLLLHVPSAAFQAVGAEGEVIVMLLFSVASCRSSFKLLRPPLKPPCLSATGYGSATSGPTLHRKTWSTFCRRCWATTTSWSAWEILIFRPRMPFATFCSKTTW